MKSTSALRFYTFVNFYLSSLQQGLQSGHCIHELFLKYRPEDSDDTNEFAPAPKSSKEEERVYDWAEYHKTMIILNGGAHEDILAKYEFLENNAAELSFPAPYDAFCEDQYSLGGLMTCVGIVVPEEIFDAVNYRTAQTAYPNAINVLGSVFDDYFFIKDGVFKHYKSGTSDHAFISLLKSCPLAR